MSNLELLEENLRFEVCSFLLSLESKSGENHHKSKIVHSILVCLQIFSESRWMEKLNGKVVTKVQDMRQDGGPRG